MSPARALGASLAVCGFALGALAQQFAAERQQYEQALEQWRQSDTGLERDATTAAPRVVLERVKNAEAMRLAAAAAKLQWLSAIRTRLAELPRPPAGTRLDAAVRANANTDVLTDLANDAKTIRDDLKTIPSSETARIASLRRQSEEVEAMRKLYSDRQAALRRIADLNKAIEAQIAAATDANKRMSAVLEAEQARVEAARPNWAAWYEAVRRNAVQRAAAMTPTPAPTAVVPPRAEAPKLPPPAAASVVRNLTGKWILTHPRPEKFSDARGPLYGDVSVLVQMTQNGDQVAGVYNGVVFVPPNEKYNPSVNFRFGGTFGPGATTFEGKIESPLSGIIRVEWAGENEIRVAYNIDRIGKAASAVSFKEGAVKVLRR